MPAVERTTSMDTLKGQLPAPPAAKASSSALELVRVWAIDGKQHVTLATDLWDDPASWGIMLVDLAKHGADAYQRTTGKEKEAVLI
jgi:hypothetical protein